MCRHCNEPLHKIGEVAKTSNVSVRTLHHYDRIGLLIPSHKSHTGHRLYRPSDLHRLEQILWLRSLGFPLNLIGDLLEREGSALANTLELQRQKLVAENAKRAEQIDRLERIQQQASTSTRVEQLSAIEARERICHTYFTRSQRERIQTWLVKMGKALVGRWKSDVASNLEAVHREMMKGTPPTAPLMRPLVATRRAIFRELTQEDREIELAFATMYRSEPLLRHARGITDTFDTYLSQATTHFMPQNN